jgi:hypothetical protein
VEYVTQVATLFGLLVSQQQEELLGYQLEEQPFQLQLLHVILPKAYA